MGQPPNFGLGLQSALKYLPHSKVSHQSTKQAWRSWRNK